MDRINSFNRTGFNLRLTRLLGKPASLSLVFLLATSAAHADFPAVIDVITDTAELSDGPYATIDGEIVLSRPMGDIDGDGIGDRIIQIPAIDDERCPGVAVLPSTAGFGLTFTRGDLNSLIRIIDTPIVDTNGSMRCRYRNLRVFHEPRRIGDINGDGLTDFIINVSGIFDNVPRIVLGTTVPGTRIDLDNLTGNDGFAVVGNGHIVFPVGDVNGDGIDDMGYASGSSTNQSIIAGQSNYGALLDVSTVSSERRLLGPTPIRSLRGLGDIDGDGFADLVAFPAGREPFAENQIPRIIRGAADLSLATLDDNNSAVTRLLAECGTRRCAILPVGDLDGDGLDDVIASQNFEENNQPPHAILYGRIDGLVVRNAINDYPPGEATRLVDEGRGRISDAGRFYRGSFNDAYRLATGQRLDLDGDGVDDLVLQERVQPGRQAWFALFGLAGQRPEVRSLREADGLRGTVFDLGTALSPITTAAPPEIADLNSDGIDDFLWALRDEAVPFVAGRSRQVDGIDVSGLVVRRGPTDLLLDWPSVDGAVRFQVTVNALPVDSLSGNTTQVSIADVNDGAAVDILVEALNENDQRLRVFKRRVPNYTPVLEAFDIQVYGEDLLELFFTPLRDSVLPRASVRLAVLRDGEIVGRTQGLSWLDAGVEPGRTYAYELVPDDWIPSRLVSTLTQQNGARLQRASRRIQVMTPGVLSESDGPIEPVDPVNPSDPVDPSTTPAVPANLRVERYSAFDAEIFWDRASEPGLRYEVRRDGVLLTTQFGISYFDSRRPANSGALYEIVALRGDGTRSAAASVTLDSLGEGTPPGGSTDPSGSVPDAPSGLRVVRYSGKDAELFWERSDEALLRYEVFRNGTLLSTQFGISYFDTRLPVDAGASYEVIALRASGSRSAAAQVSLPPVGGSSGGTENMPPLIMNLSARVYSGTAAELFWDRPEHSPRIVQYEILRDGELLGNSMGTSFFDDTRRPGIAYRYTLVAIDANGGRSLPQTIDTQAR